MPGWQIKETKDPQVPVAVVPEPQGGRKVNGRSPYQEANARLIEAAPELLAFIRQYAREVVSVACVRPRECKCRSCTARALIRRATRKSRYTR
jgi:hypothetical protein